VFSRILNYFEIYQFFPVIILCEVHRGQHQWNVYTVIYTTLLKAIFQIHITSTSFIWWVK